MFGKKTAHDVSAIVVAGGKGERMGGELPKQFMEVLGKPVLSYTIHALSACPEVAEIIIVTLGDYLVFCKDLVDEFAFRKVTSIICGGKQRQDSVYNGLLELSESVRYVVVHDGVRPLVQPETISACIAEAKRYGAAAAAVKAKDTVKIADANQMITGTADREGLWFVQTPQVFEKDLLLEAHRRALADQYTATDDCMLVERLGQPVKLVKSEYENIKITTPQDLFIMEGLLGGDGEL